MQKNFAFKHRSNGWELSPVSDLTFSVGINNQHTTDIAGSGNPDLADVSCVAQNFGIKNWQDILQQVSSVVEKENEIATSTGLSDVERKRIDSAKGNCGNNSIWYIYEVSVVTCRAEFLLHK